MPELVMAVALSRQAEGLLGEAHEAAALCRDKAIGGSQGKADARRIANRIERALQQLEAIE